ncbi:transcriptional regulator with XRE-family HTH domain [Saccharothrix violaceirubra]|uniref:Transcriptional regulator with XRE-family HTH domain n=1 Tax=Saccharothrix violaceirubra TaxID=413306 RepID=A0A7W7T193_9PSEU|nr:transcriptional regulator with XRE-family HTH domain [Saccharothrix violaceirubra]
MAAKIGVESGTVGRWERGETDPTPGLRRTVASALGLSFAQLDAVLAGAVRPGPAVGSVRASQEDWLRTRRAPGVRGRELTELAAWLYPRADRAPGGHVLAGPGWLPPEPIPVESVGLHRVTDFPAFAPPPVPVDHLLPLGDNGSRYRHYSRAVRDLVRPRLLENRPSYRLVDVDTANGLRLGFGSTTFFETFDLKQLVAHEFKHAWLAGGGRPPGFGDLPLRTAIANPFDPARLLMSPGINTLTLRRGTRREGIGFVLHERDGGKVADGGGLCHVMPAGEFQPSSAADQPGDFSLWHNALREFSEEFLGNSEHDGSGRPIDYRWDEPFFRFEAARERGTFRLWHLGLVIEPLELGVQQLTVAVVDGPEFDALFSDMVAVNDEGGVVLDRSGARYLPFTADAVDRLEPRLSATALTLLRLALDRGFGR